MLCHMQSSDSAPLSIARHAMQFIWQTSLSAHDNKIIGLLGSQVKGKISLVTHTPLWQVLASQAGEDVIQVTQAVSNSLKATSQAWQGNHTVLSGVYQCAHPTVATMQNTEKLLSPYFNQYDGIPFIHLNISFDTKGVLESEAWMIDHGQATQIPMLLTEDGQTAAKS